MATTVPTLAAAARIVRPHTAVRAANSLFLAVWFGLIAGLIEYVVCWSQVRLGGRTLLYVLLPHAPWMTVVDGLILFGAPGLVLQIMARRRPSLFPPRVAAFTFGCLLPYALRDVIFVKSWYGSLILGLGLGTVAARGAGHLHALARRTLWGVAAAASVLAVGVYGTSALAEMREARQSGRLAPGAPNVLLITLDTVRAASLSLYGYERPTSPHLEELARRGVCFDRAIAPASWTLPSHATLFTGHHPFELFHDLSRMNFDPWELPMDRTYPTLAERLGAQGYRTGGFAANRFFCDRVYGLARGFAHYQEYRVSPQQILSSAFLTRTLAGSVLHAVDPRWRLGRLDGAAINTEFLGWLDEEPSRPFFAFLNYLDAHDPYLPPPAYAARFSARQKQPAEIFPAGQTSFYPSTAARFRDEYDASIAALDDHIGRLFAELDRRHLLEQTLVILTSDHGEHLGEHNQYFHGQTLYMPVIHVPLILIFPPRVPARVRVKRPAALRDVPATVVDCLGLEESAPFPGTSLCRLWGTPASSAAEPAFSNLDMGFRQLNARAIRLRSLVDDRYHYIESVRSGETEIYDLEHDPQEKNNLIRSAEAQAATNRFRDYLRRHFDGKAAP